MDEAGLPEFGVGEAGISGCVKLRGLPFKALEQDISDFFDGYNVQRALLKRYPDGRPNGEVAPAILSQLLCVPYVITGACATLFTNVPPQNPVDVLAAVVSLSACALHRTGFQ